VYRDSLPIDVVIAELEKNKGTQFDPEIADAFLDILKNDYDKIKEIQEKYKEVVLA
jgi:HD-GYP domain-containing protein (c-di-GMP phosphodiesterase class II)